MGESKGITVKLTLQERYDMLKSSYTDLQEQYVKCPTELREFLTPALKKAKSKLNAFRKKHYHKLTDVDDDC